VATVAAVGYAALTRCVFTAVALGAAGGCGGRALARPVSLPAGIHRIRHVIVIMQENRSFDNYFGTYPGADGIPMRHGRPTVCSPDPISGRCVRPYHDSQEVDSGGPHTTFNARQDIAGGRMNGFVAQAIDARRPGCLHSVLDPNCVINVQRPDVMGYHDGRDIPNYWSYAHHFVLQDHMFASDLGWSQPSHLAMVSGWSALCTSGTDPMSCRPSTDRTIPVGADRSQPYYAWTDLTYLLAHNGVSWGYYVSSGRQPDCDDGKMSCMAHQQNSVTPSIWNPLPRFADVAADGQLGNVQDVGGFFAAAHAGLLPNVSWIVPSYRNSEHPPATPLMGESWVTRLVNAIMRSPDWNSTAIFIAWDDWGGFYDHVPPPQVDGQGYGLRVPGLLISPYARRGVVDHQTLSFDAYLKFIEDDFLGGARLDPSTDGRPDPRPDVRESAPQLGNLLSEFDFSQPPRPPFILRPRPNRRCRTTAAAGRTSRRIGSTRSRPGPAVRPTCVARPTRAP
jgi:phospholipase C